MEVDRLTSALDHVERYSEAQRDVCRAAQRLFDEIHLAGITTVTIKQAVSENNTRQPATTTTTITAHNMNLLDALGNLNDALKNLYTPGGNQ